MSEPTGRRKREFILLLLLRRQRLVQRGASARPNSYLSQVESVPRDSGTGSKPGHGAQAYCLQQLDISMPLVETRPSLQGEPSMENTSAPTALQTESSTEQPVPAAQAAPPPAVDDEVDIDVFARIKLRTATIEAVEAVPKSKKLYKLQLDVGELGKRQIVSGIAQHYTPEQLVGKQIVIIANLKPAKLMGVESQGMLLAASTEGDSSLALLTPDKPIAAGARVR